MHNSGNCSLFLVQLRPGKVAILYTKIYLIVKAAKKLL